MAEGRICSTCKVYKDREFFGNHKGKCRSQCKACEKEYYERTKEQKYAQTKKYRQENAEKYKEQVRRSEEKNKVHKQEYGKRYYLENKEAINAKNKRNYEKNKEAWAPTRKAYRVANYHHLEFKRKQLVAANRDYYNQKAREWRRANPEKVRAIMHKRRAAAMGAEGYFTADDVKAMYVAQEGRCFYCNCDISEYYEVEHKTPLSRGGSNWSDNLSLTCRPCNAQKLARTHEEFLEHRKIQEKLYLHDLLLHWR